MNFGKTIRIFLVDGTTNGLTTAELSNWTGIGVKVPKIKLRDYANRTEFKKQGVYLLLGKDEDNAPAAYIGEAEVMFDRLSDHVIHKDFWTEAIFFGSKDSYINKASVKYLENRLFEIALTAERYTLNQNIPSRPALSEAEVAELEEFLVNIKTLTSALGHRIFESIEETVERKNESTIILYCTNGAGAQAKGSLSTDGFVVYKDSLFIIPEQASLADGIRAERKKMLDDQLLVEDGGFYRLIKDYIFTSPSRAASAILARSASGPLEWRNEERVQLKMLDADSE